MKLLDFAFQGSEIDVAGRSFDLHNFDLLGYMNDTKGRMFSLQLKREMTEEVDTTIRLVITDLQIIFRDVTFLRIQDSPFDEQHVCLASMEFVDTILAKPTPKPSMLVQINNLFDSDEFPEAEWSNYLMIVFIGGVGILIAAATAEVAFQTVTPRRDI